MNITYMVSGIEYKVNKDIENALRDFYGNNHYPDYLKFANKFGFERACELQDVMGYFIETFNVVLDNKKYDVSFETGVKIAYETFRSSRVIQPGFIDLDTCIESALNKA